MTTLILHGGAWDIPNNEVEAHKEGLREALDIGVMRLVAGADAVQAVTEVIRYLEDHPAFDAGYGSVLNAAGEVEMDAGLIMGHTRDFGAVAGVKHINNPIEVAAYIAQNSRGKFYFLVGKAADDFAKANNFTCRPNDFFITPRERERFKTIQQQERFHTSHPFRGKRPQGTVGAVALDAHGRIAAGTSTGGAPYKIPGRVGDSPLIGAGFYATETAGASATGWGEALAKNLICYQLVRDQEGGLPPQEAAEKAIRQLAETIKDPDGRDATGGIITLNKAGEIGWHYNTPRMARAWWQPGRDIIIDV